MVIFGGGPRLVHQEMETTYRELAQICAAESTSCFPPEEALGYASWISLYRILATQLACDMLSQVNLVLVGHSFGIAVAHNLSAHLEKEGVDLRGIVALDLRHTPAVESLPIPRALKEFARPRVGHFHLKVSTLDFSVPMVPRGYFQGTREFVLMVERAATASWLATATSHVPAVLNDADHFDVCQGTSWDIATKLATLLPKTSRARGRTTRPNSFSGKANLKLP